MLKRPLYIAYYLKQMQWPLLAKMMKHVMHTNGASAVGLWGNMFYHALRYNISLLEFFQFRFFERNHLEKMTWAGTGYMYEFQLKMNPKSKRSILDDKTQFYKAYKKFFVHEVADIMDLSTNTELAEHLLANPSGKLVFKVADGKCGKQVMTKSAKDFDRGLMIGFMKRESYDLVEEFIIQHPALNELSPSAVNTVRIFTQLNENDEVVILGCRQRISVNSSVDNMAVGNLAAPIDEVTGIINGPGVYSDITKQDESIHPVTGVSIVGFQIPFWQETLNLVKEAALAHPQNRSIGWDVVITEKGPGLIEGNHDWCKLLWQLPVKKGLKPQLGKYF